jgi:hypothetical protein
LLAVTVTVEVAAPLRLNKSDDAVAKTIGPKTSVSSSEVSKIN